MSMLTLIQDFCRRTNIQVPGSVLGSTDSQVLQILALLEEEGEDLADRGDWQELTKEATHTTVATESQGVITTIAPGFDHFKTNTFWDRDLRLPVYVIDDKDWQQVKAVAVTGPRYQARLRGNELLANPTPTAGNTWAFEYQTKNWITDLNGNNPSDSFNADTDLVLLPEKLLKMGLRWRWKKEKGFDYDEDFQTYENMVTKALGSNGLKRNLNMSDGPLTRQPKVYVPDGNWI